MQDQTTPTPPPRTITEDQLYRYAPMLSRDPMETMDKVSSTLAFLASFIEERSDSSIPLSPLDAIGFSLVMHTLKAAVDHTMSRSERAFRLTMEFPPR